MSAFRKILQYLIILLFITAVLNAVVLIKLADVTAKNLPQANGGTVLGRAIGTVGVVVMVCGDGLVHGSEPCDGNATNGSTCSSFGYGSGTIGCFANCTFNTAPCTTHPSVRFINTSSAFSFLQNTQVNISANVSDDVRLSVIFASVTNPNGSVSNVTMLRGSTAFNTTNPPNNFSISFNSTSQTGAYTIRIVANDSEGNVNDTETSVFTVTAAEGGNEEERKQGKEKKKDIGEKEQPTIARPSVTPRNLENVRPTSPPQPERPMKSQLFDVKNEVNARFKEILPGNDVYATIALFYLGDERLQKTIDIGVYYAILDAEGKIVTDQFQTIGIQTRVELLGKLAVPMEMSPGRYWFYTRITVNKEVAESFDTFEVLREPKLQQPSRLMPSQYTLILIFILSIFLLIIVHHQYVFERHLATRHSKISEEDLMRLGELIKRIEKER